MMRFSPFLLLFSMGLFYLACPNPLLGKTSFQHDEHTQKIFKQERLLKEGSALVEKGLYDDAIKKYKEALDPSVLNGESDRGNAIYYIGEVYKLQNRYEEALGELQWCIKRNPSSEKAGWLDEKLELEALIAARDARSLRPILENIGYLKKKYARLLPPQKWLAGMTDTISSTIIRLYEHIGDVDGGITFVDGMLKLAASGKAGKDTQRYANTTKNPYFVIKQAFEQDKKEGFKGCLEAKPGEVCMGHATKALIQSDYFPW